MVSLTAGVVSALGRLPDKPIVLSDGVEVLSLLQLMSTVEATRAAAARASRSIRMVKESFPSMYPHIDFSQCAWRSNRPAHRADRSTKPPQPKRHGGDGSHARDSTASNFLLRSKGSSAIGLFMVKILDRYLQDVDT